MENRVLAPFYFIDMAVEGMVVRLGDSQKGGDRMRHQERVSGRLGEGK